MKIALTIHALHGGGAERQLAELANHLACHNHQVTVVTWDKIENDQYCVSAQVQRLGLDLMGDSRNVLQGVLANRKRVRVLKRTLTDLHPDLIISFTDKMNIATLAAAPPAPVIIAERSDPRKQRLTRLWEFWRSRTYHRAACMVALTEPIANALRKRFAHRHVIVIPNAVTIPTPQELALEPSLPASGVPTNRRAIAVGRLSPEKGFDLLLQAWKLATAHQTDWELVIVGDGSQRPVLEKEIARLQLESKVTLAGWSQAIAQQYLAADLFISASHYEAMSRSLLEAMSHGLPIITTRATDGLEELVRENENGWLVPTGNCEALTTAIRQAIDQPDRLKAMGENSRIFVQRHSWEAIGPRWLALIEAVAAGQKNA